MTWGNLKKLEIRPAIVADQPVQYTLVYGDHRLELNPLLGKTLSIEFSGRMNCVGCGKELTKTYQDGYCFPCTQRLAQCDICIVRPELCHFDDGTCREPEWAKTHCFIPHYVYLSNASGIKVGITRHTQIPTRWLDQGAIQALIIFKVGSRYLSGLMEKLLREQISDKTNWREMLKGDIPLVDLEQRRDELLELAEAGIEELEAEFGEEQVEYLEDESVYEFHYPVLQYPQKIKTLGLDKTPKLEATLLGMKGQYLFLDSGVINIRKHTGYQIRINL